MFASKRSQPLSKNFCSVTDIPSVRSGLWRRHNYDNSLIAILASQANANLRIMWPAPARREAVREFDHQFVQPAEVRNGHAGFNNHRPNFAVNAGLGGNGGRWC